MAKKPYSLDFTIERDTDRVAAVRAILDSLEFDPSPSDLEQMGSYILYGKDENNLNGIQKGEMTDGYSKRFKSFKKTDDNLLSLEAIMENPLQDEQEFAPLTKKSIYNQKKTTIKRPKYDKQGRVVDIGDGDIPGMADYWDSIDRLEHWIAILEGKIPPDETHSVLQVDPYRLYQLKHQLIDLRRHQYYLKDSYKPTIHFVAIDRPKAQYYDWNSDCFYWISLDEWQRRVNSSLLHTISKNLEDYETRAAADGTIEVKWVVRQHTFDYENPAHIKALIDNYGRLYEYFREKPDTYGRAMLLDFDRYRAMCNFSELRSFILDKRLEQVPVAETRELILRDFGIEFTDKHISYILSVEIPKKIVEEVKKARLLDDCPPSTWKKCYTCGKSFPRDLLFFTRNNSRKDGFSSNCKECERIKRLQKKVKQNADQKMP